MSAGLSLQDLRSIQANLGGIAATTARKRLVPTKLLPKPQGDMPTLYGVGPPTSASATAGDARPVLHRGRRHAAAPVAVLGQAAAAACSARADPLGQFVKVNQQWFRVIGVAGPQLSPRAMSRACRRRIGTT